MTWYSINAISPSLRLVPDGQHAQRRPHDGFALVLDRYDGQKLIFLVIRDGDWTFGPYIKHRKTTIASDVSEDEQRRLTMWLLSDCRGG